MNRVNARVLEPLRCARVQMRRYVDDVVKVYSISVSNALDGVASSCRACALVAQNSQQAGSSCVPCPAGFFIHRETNRCQECPPDTVLSGRHISGQDACVACGPGSISNAVRPKPKVSPGNSLLPV